ncbi:MAG: ShlB/FhaC/HecB family hemolysin secretion/activation protein [Aquabacterium sp.]
MKPLHRAPFMRASGVACFVLGALSVSSALAQAQATPPAPSAPPAAAAAPAAAVPTFDVLEFEVEGNTVLPVAAVEKAVTPFMGPGKTIADVEAARAALEKAYQDAGFLTVFVDLPEQSTAEGVIRLSVLEGRVERLAVTGSHYFSQGRIRERVPELSEGKVPNFNVVQAQLAEVNRTDDRRVQPVLRPGHNPGAVEAELQVTDKLPLHGTVELNNNHAQFTPQWRLQTALHYDNLFQSDNSLTFMAITAPQNPSASKVFSLDYAVPTGGGDSWRYTLLYSDSNVDALGAATILGKGYDVGLKRQLALTGTASLNHTLTLGVDYKNNKESTLAGGDSIYTPVRYIPFSIDYTGFLQWESGGLSSLSAQNVFGFKRLMQHNHDCGFGDADQFECKRAGADGGFAYLRLDARHSQPIQKWHVDVRVAGQIASQALIGAEQYALGGPDAVRGYLSAEAVGDNGAMGSLEVHTPNLMGGTDTDASKQPWWGTSEGHLYGFIDGGRVRTINASAGQVAAQSLASFGLGFKLKTYRYFNLTLEWAQPLKDASVTQARHPHLHTALSVEF